MAAWTRLIRASKVAGGSASRSQKSAPRLMTGCWPCTLCPPEQPARRLGQTARAAGLDHDRVAQHHVAGFRDVLVGMDHERHVLLEDRAGVRGDVVRHDAAEPQAVAP